MSGAKRWPVWLVVWGVAAGAGPRGLASQAGLGALVNARDSAAVAALLPEPVVSLVAPRLPESATRPMRPIAEYTQQLVIVDNRVTAICTFAVLTDSSTVWLSSAPDSVLEHAQCADLYYAWLERQTQLGRRLKPR
jgi:hypothetical protein